MIDIWRISDEIATGEWWMPQDLTGDKSTLNQVKACCLTAPSRHLKQYLSSKVFSCIQLIAISKEEFINFSKSCKKIKLIYCHLYYNIWSNIENSSSC